MESLAAVLPEFKKGWWGATLDLKNTSNAWIQEPTIRTLSSPQILHQHSESSDGAPLKKGCLRLCIPGRLAISSPVRWCLETEHPHHLRKKGVYVFVYLDDWLLTAPSAGVLSRNILITKRLVHSLGKEMGKLMGKLAGKTRWENSCNIHIHTDIRERVNNSLQPSLFSSHGCIYTKVAVSTSSMNLCLSCPVTWIVLHAWLHYGISIKTMHFDHCQ